MLLLPNSGAVKWREWSWIDTYISNVLLCLSTWLMGSDLCSMPNQKRYAYKWPACTRINNVLIGMSEKMKIQEIKILWKVTWKNTQMAIHWLVALPLKGLCENFVGEYYICYVAEGRENHKKIYGLSERVALPSRSNV